MRKKGAVSSTFIVSVILLLVAFGIMLFFVTKFIINSDIDRETCHQSVVLKATLPGDKISLKGYIPLKCQTKKICITDKGFLSGKGDCEEFKGEDYGTYRVNSDEEKREQEIKMTVARELAESWNTMGEGKVQIFAREFKLFGHERRCVIYSRIAFDKELKEEMKNIEGLGEYLITRKVPNKEETYWEYLNKGSSVENYNPSKDVYSLDEKAIVYLEIDKSTAPSWLTSIFGGGAGGVGAGIVGAKIGGAIGSIVPVAGTISGAIVGFIGGSIVGGYAGNEIGEMIEEEMNLEGEMERITKENYLGGWFIIDYNKASLESLNCDSFEEIS